MVGTFHPSRPDKVYIAANVTRVLYTQAPSSQLCTWTAAFWCLLKSRRPQPPHLRPNLPLQASHSRPAPTVNKFQWPPVQETVRRRWEPPRTRQGRPLKVQPANPKDPPAPPHQQKPLNCKVTRTGGEAHGGDRRPGLTCFLHCFLFSTSEQSRIGIPTLGDTIDGHANPPAVVIYIVDAFLNGSGRNEVEEEGDEVEAGSIWLLGLLRCYTEMLQTLPEGIRPALVLQVGWYFRNKTNLIPPSLLQSPSWFLIFLFRWFPASTSCSQPAGTAICTCSVCAPWPSPVTPSADACCPNKRTSSP